MSKSQIVHQNSEEQEVWDEDDSEDDDDIDAEAEAIARRLGEELWADIRKAKAEGAAASASGPSRSQDSTTSPTPQHGTVPLSTACHITLRKEDEALNTIRSILKFIETDPLARTVLASSIVKPGEETVLAALENMATSGSIPKDSAMPLSVALVGLGKSDALFACLRLSDAQTVQPASGKRKRDESDQGPQQQANARPYKRSYVESDLQASLEDAVRVITLAFSASTTKTLDPSVISSIRLQLHQVFLFAVTSSTADGHNMHALQEISGLIQVIGVLSGIQIGQPTENIDGHAPQSSGANTAYPWFHGQSPATTNIGTAVFPCLVDGCGKTFSRLYSLRGHQRLHTVHRPFRCNSCPASFARNHDLKRHMKLHSNNAWKCAGCSKVFSRRDAIKRHRNGSKARGPRGEACIDADVLEVELGDEEGEESAREERRTKMWSGIAVNQISGTRNQDESEEGEIPPPVVSGIQTTVLSIHGLLQTHVASVLGTSVGQSVHPPGDATGGQATLASVIARAQSQTLPKNVASGAIGTPSSLGHVVQVQTASQPETGSGDVRAGAEPSAPALSMYGLSDEQTRLLEEAIANAALAAQAQAEAEAALEEQEDEDEDYEEEDQEHSEGQPQTDKTTDGLAEDPGPISH